MREPSVCSIRVTGVRDVRWALPNRPPLVRMLATRVGRRAAMKRTHAALSMIAAALFGVVAAVPAPAIAADNTVSLTLNCIGNGPTSCTGSWSWYQGGTNGTLLSSGSISGNTRGTTVQPATADTVLIGIRQPAGKEACGASQADSFSPGGHINVTVRLHEQPNAYHFGCFDTFSMKS
jgi:hypothetical protein